MNMKGSQESLKEKILMYFRVKITAITLLNMFLKKIIELRI